jgi:hypothetical protein
MIEMEFTKEELIPPEQKLFRAVISLSFEDAMALNCSRSSAVLKSKAHRWFTNGGQDFITICNLAGLEPQHIKDKYLNMWRSKQIHFTDKEIRYINSYWKFFNRRNKHNDNTR